MWFELDNPFIDTLKNQISELERKQISQELYIAKAKDTLKYLEKWLEEVTKLTIMKQVYNIKPVKVVPASTNFDTENKQKRREAVEKLNKPS